MRGLLVLPTWTIGLLFVVALPAVVVLIRQRIHRRWPRLAQGEQNEVVGFIFATVGVIYAVLLAFVVVVTWEEYRTAEGIVDREASALRSIYRDSAAFPPEAQADVRAQVVRYTTAVVTWEWPAMARGEAGDPKVAAALDEMSTTLAHVPATTPTEEQYIGTQAERFNELVSLRSERLDYADRDVPNVLWVALIIGAVVTIGFVLAFGLQHVALHTLMTASLAALIGIQFFVIITIDYPFVGDVAVQSQPLQRVLTDFSK
jgi:hypothetical protein